MLLKLLLSSRKEVTALNKKFKNSELFTVTNEYLLPLFEGKEYPWQILSEIKNYIQTLLEHPPEGFSFLCEGVLVGKNVTVAQTATILPPAVIGTGTEIRPNAYLRGNVITGEDCALGNASEFKNCVLLNHVQAPHYNYVGDSILGNHAHLGAGAICSNLKADKTNVVIHADTDMETGLRKIGAILADGADIGCGCVLNPGTVVGKNTRVYPLTSLRGVIPKNKIVKSMENITEQFST